MAYWDPRDRILDSNHHSPRQHNWALTSLRARFSFLVQLRRCDVGKVGVEKVVRHTVAT